MRTLETKKEKQHGCEELTNLVLSLGKVIYTSLDSSSPAAFTTTSAAAAAFLLKHNI